MASCCSACSKGRPCCGSRKNPSSPRPKLLGGDKSQIAWIVGNFHVSTPDEEIVADMRRRLEVSKTPKGLHSLVIKYALRVHHNNQKLYTSVMRGSR